MAPRLHLLLASSLLVPFMVAQEVGLEAAPPQPIEIEDEHGTMYGIQFTAPPALPATTFQFEKREHDFGWVLQDSENTYVFKFKNNGTVPLVIENAIGSCGCTVPDYSKAPIMPGGESEITVVYKPGKQEGDQLKTVTITANTQPGETLLRIHAEVLTADPGRASTPYTFEPLPPPVERTFDPLPPSIDRSFDPLSPMGEVVRSGPISTVQFEEMEHDFGQILQGSENPYVFKFKNTGNVPLIIQDAKGSCGCTVPFYAKDPILPGEESEIHVVYKPGKQEGKQNKTVTITANTEPSTTLLRISAEVLVNDSADVPSLFVLQEEHEKDREAIASVSPGCFVIFPNPASHELRLDLKEHIGLSADVLIRDEAGREMLQTRIGDISSEASRLDIAAFPAGIYIATIQVEGKPPMSQCFVVDK